MAQHLIQSADSSAPVARKVIKTTTSVCPSCLTKVPATVSEEQGEVIMLKRCPTHGEQRVLVESNPDFYWHADAAGKGCGPGGCLFNHSCTLIFEITEKCNLSCPTCFSASSPEQQYFLPLERFKQQLDWLLEHGKQDADIMQLSGGEPTLHPDLEAMVEYAFERGLKKVYVNTNGVLLGKDPRLAERLGKWAGRLQIYLQLDGFRDQTYAQIRGASGLASIKKTAIENALSHGIYVLPVVTMTRGVNADEVGALLQLALDKHPLMNTVILQPAMYAGRYDNDQTMRRMTTGDVIDAVEQQTQGMFNRADFGPMPCSHPNCFVFAVGVKREGKLMPISRYFPDFESWGEPGGPNCTLQ